VIRDDYLATARAAGVLLRDPAVAAGWDSPSALPEFSVRGLAGHLAFQVFVVRMALDAPQATEETIPMVEHYRRSRWIGAPLDDDFNVGIRTGGEQLAADGPAALADRFDAAVDALAADLPGESNRAVRMRLWGPWTLSVDDFLVTRTMELAVHADDLAYSVRVDPPRLPAAAVERVVDLLTRVALHRHGQTAVLRALSRAERAPGSIAAI
jgi:mycothiol maleylpyruvate isomerase-like protein